jgi:hypothetical protein
MILYVTVAVVTVLLASLVNNRIVTQPYSVTRQQLCNRVSLTAIFVILFSLSACRLNVGNDYAKYVEFMHLVWCDSYVPTEIGFNLLVKLVYRLSGFENYLLIFAIYAFATVGLFLAAIYDLSDEFGLSFFLFMALGYYFQTFSTVRYYLALAIALYSMKYVLRGQWGRFLLLILLGATFHKSLLVVIPLYFLATRRWKKWQLAVAALFCVSFLFLQDFYLKVVVWLYPTYEDTEYLEGGTSYINILRCAAVLIFALAVLWMERRQTLMNNDTFRFYFYLNLGALALYVFCSFLPIISRIGYYLTVSHILFLPMLLRKVGAQEAASRMSFAVRQAEELPIEAAAKDAVTPDRKDAQSRLRWQQMCRAGVVAAGVLYFIMYLSRAGNDGVLILPYKTFFFHDMVNILSDVN